MKRTVLLIFTLFIAIQSFGQAKYVFLFIGDGTGANMVNYTEFYKGAMEGKVGISPLIFSTFPVCNVATTFQYQGKVTDSAASGTAIACGKKTSNGALGVGPEGERYTSIAETAAKNGKKVGIMSNVEINHATPGAFFGHQKSRGNADQLIADMLADNFDFYGGCGIMKSNNYKTDVFEDCKNAGYTVCRNNDDFKAGYQNASKILFIPDKEHAVKDAIDRQNMKPGESICISDFVSSAIQFFMKDNCKQGFFIMCEGGIIDHLNHGNDAAGAVREVIDLDEAVRIAYEFYLRHPKETAIIVTADHDTGGPGVEVNPETIVNLQYQKHSIGKMTALLKEKMKEKGKEPLSWDEVSSFLSEEMGMWSKFKVSENDEKYLKEIYEKTIAKNETGNVTDEYGYNHNAEIVAKAAQMVARNCGFKYTTGGHTAAYVPVFYIGPKPEIFSVKMDNSFFYNKIAEIARYK